jgi:hypothetical protein
MVVTRQPTTEAGTMQAGKRDYWVEITKPDGRGEASQWINSADGYGTLAERLTGTARVLLGYAPMGSTARVYAGVPTHANPLPAVVTLTSPVREI